MKRLNPEKYPAFYKQGGYGFLRQGEIDEFRHLVYNILRKDSLFYKEHLAKEKSWQSSEDPWESFKDFCYTEGQLGSIDQMRELSDELAVIGMYRFIEVERATYLANIFPGSDARKMSNIRYLESEFPFLKELFGAAQVNELRLLNNCIKHSGIVSSQLAKCDESWTVGCKLSGIGAAYERLAPFFGGYWVDLTQTARDLTSQSRRSDTR